MYVSFIFRGEFRDGWDFFLLTVIVSITGYVVVGVFFKAIIVSMILIDRIFCNFDIFKNRTEYIINM